MSGFIECKQRNVVVFGDAAGHVGNESTLSSGYETVASTNGGLMKVEVEISWSEENLNRVTESVIQESQTLRQRWRWGTVGFRRSHK
jgi:hypothetical protein